jgi:formate dehydrogenase subunit gamma
MKRHYSAPGDEIASRMPVTVRRYKGYTRLNHCLTGLFGGGPTTRWLHPFVGVLLFFSFLLLFLQMWRLNLPQAGDGTWMAHLGDVMAGHEENLPEIGKYNAGQKMVFWAMTGLILVLIVTGVMIWQQYFPDLVPIPTRRIAIAVHALAAVGILFVFILHVYAAFWTRGTIRAMTRGTVTGGWAFRHHRKWLRELAGRQGHGPAE